MLPLTYDIEADDLLDKATKIHCICAISGNQEWVFTDGVWPDKNGDLRDFFSLIRQYPAAVCHNQIGYDLPLMRRLLGIDYHVWWSDHQIDGHKIEIIDSLVDSKWLWPDRPIPKAINWNEAQKKRIGPHGLEAWGYRVSGTKPFIDDWKEKPLGEYIHRCLEDVRNNQKVFIALTDEMRGYFGGETWQQVRKNARVVLNIEHTFAWRFQVQETHGIKFDIQAAEELRDRMDEECLHLATEIEPNLPEVDIPKSNLAKYKFPSKLVTKEGKPAANFLKFLERNEATIDGEDLLWNGKRFTYPFPEYLTTKQPLLLSNTDGIKQYFLDKGWVPTMFNVKKDAAGKPIRDEKNQVINTSPMMRDRLGNICPNLLEMDDEMIRKILRYDAVSRRRAIIESKSNEDKGWLNNERLAVDGRLPAGANTGGANTGRVTHKVVCNVPRPNSPVYGLETRQLFTVDREKFYFVGYDASGLEAGTLGHFTWEYDDGEFATELLTGDPHTTHRVLWSLNQADGRNLAKTCFYALIYGAQLGRFTATIKKPQGEASRDYDAFWEARPSVKAAIDSAVAEWERNGKKYIRGIDGRPIHTRAKHSVFNAKNQSCGAIVMKLAACIMAQWMREYPDCNRILDYHDEEAWEVPKDQVKWKRCKSKEEAIELQKEAYHSKPVEKDGVWWSGYCIQGELGVKSIEKAGKFFKLNVPLTGEYTIAYDWSAH